MNDKPIIEFWNSIKDSAILSGSVQGAEWSELWDDAREKVRRMYAAAWMVQLRYVWTCQACGTYNSHSEAECWSCGHKP